METYLEDTIYTNYKLVIDDTTNTPVAVMIDGVIKFRLGDKVLVTADSHGYICPDIYTPGYGKIDRIKCDSTDHFFGIRMFDSNEFGFVKAARIQKI